MVTVLHRPKFRKYFSSADIMELAELIVLKAVEVDITHNFTDCRDSKDNFLLNPAVSGEAGYLVTGDNTNSFSVIDIS